MDATLHAPRSTDEASIRQPRSPLRGVLVGMELVLALSALGGAVTLVLGQMDLGREVVDELPFQSTLLAGISLGMAIGVLPVMVAIGAIRRATWAPLGHLVVGCVLVGWIVVQVGFIGLTWFLQPVMGAYGLVIIGLALWNLQLLRRPSLTQSG